MKLLIDIGHPAHVHLYKYFYYKMILNGHQLYVTTKDLQSAKDLLTQYGIPYVILSKKSDSLIGKMTRQIVFDWKLFKIVISNTLVFGLGTSITTTHISKVTKMKSIVMDDDDDEVQPLFVKYAHPFADCILSPDVLKGKRKRKDTIYYAGYHELAYLHPNRFKPNPQILNEIGLKIDEPFFIMRFNAFKAHHDIGVRGLSIEQKLKLIEILSGSGQIFITAERDIEPELLAYQLKISPEKTHSLLYYAKMFVGDSQTMTSEAAVLGTPAIRCNSFVGRISYLEEEEIKYGLTYGFKPEDFSSLLKKVHELLAMPNLKEEWQRRRQRMLADKIDVTAFMVWFVENYPDSARVMREYPDYQYRFK